MIAFDTNTLFQLNHSALHCQLDFILDNRSLLSDNINHMKGSEFIRHIRKLGRKNDVQVVYVTRRGKGSHGTLFYGENFTIIRNPKDELKTGTMHAMLDQLDLTLNDLGK